MKFVILSIVTCIILVASAAEAGPIGRVVNRLPRFRNAAPLLRIAARPNRAREAVKRVLSIRVRLGRRW